LGTPQQSVIVKFFIILDFVMELSRLVLAQTKRLNHSPELFILRLIVSGSAITAGQLLDITTYRVWRVLKRMCVAERRIGFR
jgi:uncharacterized PurR-regulated membrane protein YhhQ (DUF165 family)